MKFKMLVAAVAAVALSVPAAAPASQPDVSLSDLRDDAYLTPSLSNMALLLLAPERAVQFSLVLPQAPAMLDSKSSPF